MSNINVTGQQAYFNEDAKFFKDVYIYGTLYYDFETKNVTEVFQNIEVKGNAEFLSDVYINGNLNVGILTVRKRLDVGIGGTVLRAIADLEGLPFLTGKVGIGSTSPKQSLDVIGNTIVSGQVGIGSAIPQQRLDIAGSVKIDENIYDSVNVPGRNGYQLSRDIGGIRWIPLIVDGASPGVGFGTVVGLSTYSEGIFILDEGVPLYPE
jgi:hypothetical protein